MLGHASRAHRRQRHAPRQLEPATAGQLRRRVSTPFTITATATCSRCHRSAASTTSRSATSARSTWTGTPSSMRRWAGSRVAGSRSSRSRSSRCATTRDASRSGASTSGGPCARRTSTRIWRRSQAAWGGTAIARFSAAATLVGLEAPPAAMNLEIKPYAIAGLSTDLVSHAVARSNDCRPDAGFDVKYGLTEEHHRGLHLQHRLRAGRGRRGAGQPDAVQPVVSGEAGVLSRGPRNIRLRRHWRCRRSCHLLQPPHRVECQPAHPDHRRRPRDRKGGQVEHRRAQHHERR